MIHFDSISKIYPDNTVGLSEVTFSIDPQEFVSIVGPSGAGKSTLLRMLLAEDRPTDGSIFIGSTNILDLDKYELNDLRRNIGVVFQDFRLLPHKTVYENVSFAMEAAGKSDQEIEEDVPYALELVGIDHKYASFPNQLSGGEQQRTAIARAIVNRPEIIVADEPTGNLDPVNTFDIVDILRKVNELDTTVILATHNTGVIDNLAKRVVTIEGGRLVKDSKTDRINSL